MALFYIYRLVSFGEYICYLPSLFVYACSVAVFFLVVAMFAAIVLLGLCSHSIAAIHHAGAVSATYLNLGVAAAGASLISLPIMCVDCSYIQKLC